MKKTFRPWGRIKARKAKKRLIKSCMKHFLLSLIPVWAVVMCSFAYTTYEAHLEAIVPLELGVKGALAGVDPVPTRLTTNQNAPTQGETVEAQIRRIAKEANFKWPDYLVKLSWCESSHNPKAIGDHGKSRGLFQIHKGYHPSVSDECAFSVECSTKWTMAKINAGYQKLWSCDRIIK